MVSWPRHSFYLEEAATGERQQSVWAIFVGVYAWFLILQLLDLGSTLAVLQHGGIEANQLGPSQAVEAYGTEALLGLKLIVVVLSMLTWLPAVAWLERRQAVESGSFVVALILVGAVVYTAVVLGNFSVLRMLAG